MRKTEAIQAGLAPRFADAWHAVKTLLDDSEWHTYDELEAAINATGLATRSAENLIRDLRLDGWLAATSQRGRQRQFRLPRVAP